MIAAVLIGCAIGLWGGLVWGERRGVKLERERRASQHREYRPQVVDLAARRERRAS
jgi:hypothetical protein